MSKQISAPVSRALYRVSDKISQIGCSDDEEKISVHDTVSKMAFFYEKVRNAIDYHEDHLWRKNAIKRILKRRMQTTPKAHEMAKMFLNELIRARYLANRTLPETKIKEVEEIIEKYLLLRRRVTENERRKTIKRQTDWILDLAACEIEENLTPPLYEQAAAELMYEVVNRDLQFTQRFSYEERSTQVYIAVQRVLLRYDRARVRFNLYKLYYPAWIAGDEETVDKAVREFEAVSSTIERQIKHSLGFRLYRLCQKKYTPLFVVLYDIISQNPDKAESILADEAVFEAKIIEACKRRYKESGRKRRRSAVRSIIYIFATKIILAMALEIPAEYYLQQQFHLLSIALNVLFPPLLMFSIIMLIRLPTAENTKAIAKGLKEIVYNFDERQVIRKVKVAKRSAVMSLFFDLVYLAMYLLTFGLVYLGLRELQVTVISGAIFMLFLCLISFFGLRIRAATQELLLVEKRENFLSFLVDFLTLPIVRAGRWISQKSSKINIFIFILDFIIEAPFKGMIEVFEQLIYFIKEKKEETY